MRFIVLRELGIRSALILPCKPTSANRRAVTCYGRGSPVSVLRRDVSGRDRAERSSLNGSQPVYRLSGGRVERAIRLVELLVELCIGGVRLDAPGHKRPVRRGREKAGSDAGQERVAVAGADGLGGKQLLASTHVGHDLRPQPTLRSTAHSDDALRGTDGILQELDDLADTECDS